jgi:titin
LGFSSESTTSVTLTWSAPSNNGDTEITGYRIEYSVNSNFSGASAIEVGNVGSRNITGLSLDRTYYFRVAARNAVTASAGSHSVWSGTVQKSSRPNTPSINVSRSGLTYTISGSTTIGDGSVESHRFSSRTSTNGGVTFGSWSSETTIGTSSYSTTFSSTAATSYQFRVRAVSATGLFGAYRESSIVHTPAVPLIPTTAIAVSKNVRKVTVDWDAFRTSSNSNAVYNGAVISSYQVEARYSNDNGATWVISYENIGNPNAATTVLITNDLLIAKTYQFRVRAISDVGNSDYQSSPLIFISAYGQRRGDSGFLPIENAKRFDGTSWQTVLMAKRFNGTSWVDLTN